MWHLPPPIRAGQSRVFEEIQIGDSVTETVELTRAECLRLLGEETVGRVVFTAAAMPAAEPVDYILHSGELIFQVPLKGPLATATRNAVVGFQVDDIDPTTHAGWSVTGIGQTYEVTDMGRRGALASNAPGWDPDMLAIALPLQQLSGHQIKLGTTVR
jgi:hypothetical protein